MKHGKKYNESLKLIDHLKQYDPETGLRLEANADPIFL